MDLVPGKWGFHPKPPKPQLAPKRQAAFQEFQSESLRALTLRPPTLSSSRLAGAFFGDLGVRHVAVVGEEMEARTASWLLLLGCDWVGFFLNLLLAVYHTNCIHTIAYKTALFCAGGKSHQGSRCWKHESAPTRRA